MIRRVPERTCIACRQSGGKRGFCRVVRTPEGELLVDRTGKRSGRGAYVHPVAACVREALRGDRLAKALRTQVTAADKARLEADLTHLVARAELLGQLSRTKEDASAPAPRHRGRGGGEADGPLPRERPRVAGRGGGPRPGEGRQVRGTMVRVQGGEG